MMISRANDMDDILRKVSEVGPGDYIESDSGFEKIEAIYGLTSDGKPSDDFAVKTVDGAIYSWQQIKRFLKVEDL